MMSDGVANSLGCEKVFEELCVGESGLLLYEPWLNLCDVDNL